MIKIMMALLRMSCKFINPPAGIPSGALIVSPPKFNASCIFLQYYDVGEKARRVRGMETWVVVEQERGIPVEWIYGA